MWHQKCSSEEEKQAPERTSRWSWSRVQWHYGNSSSFPSAEKVQWGFKWSKPSTCKHVVFPYFPSFLDCDTLLWFWECLNKEHIKVEVVNWEFSVCVPHSPGGACGGQGCAMGTLTCAMHCCPAGMREAAQTECWNLSLLWQLARKDLRLMQCHSRSFMGRGSSLVQKIQFP